MLDFGPLRPYWLAQRTEFNHGLVWPELRALYRDLVSFVMPFWCLLVLTAIPTAILWHRDRRTVKPGCCRQCGYDLRASKKVCPECGRDFNAPPA